MNILPIETIKCLSLVSHEISTTMKPFIERNYWFVLYDVNRRFTYYSPQNLKSVRNVDQITLSTKKLKTFHNLNKPIDLLHFTHITHLDFGFHFNKPIDNLLPPNITHLKFGFFFNQPVDNLPQNITHLTFGFNFNTLVDNLPPNIKHLNLGFIFNAPVNNLPQSITHLSFGPYFTHPLTTLPPNTKLVQFKFNRNISSQFNHPIAHLNPNIIFQLVDDYTKETTPYQYNPN